MEDKMKKLNEYSVGWVNYFTVVNVTSKIRDLEMWIMRRLRACIWKQWKKKSKPNEIKCYRICSIKKLFCSYSSY